MPIFLPATGLVTGRVRYRRGAVTFNGAIKRSLNWPEDLRKIVEKELSDLQEPNESWMTVRYQLRENSIRIYVNDHIFLDYSAAKFDPSGMLRIHMSGGARLASVHIRLLPALPRTYEPVSIRHHINASTLSGATIERASLPPAGLEVDVQDIPFIFPEPIDGKDHVDLGSSWFRAGNLTGHLSGRLGPFGGRWTDPMVDSLARIQFRVPNGRYNAIHLVAAYDGDKNTTPVVTAQFYKPTAGFPENFSTTVPLFSAKSTDARALPVRLTNGKKGNLYLVTIPIEPGVLAAFDDLDYLAVELTKEVKLYRAYPDPSYYSFHSAGLPSGVHVYAMTFRRPTVEMAVDAKEFANTWVAPARPSYAATLKNNTDKPRKVELVLTSKSYDGKETTEQKRSVNVPANRPIKTVFSLSLKRYGYHDVNLKMMDDTREWNETLNLAYLHKDTRKRGDWDVGKGPLWGFWHWGGGHGTPSGPEQTRLMALAGAESRSGSFKQATEEEKKIAEQFGMVSMKHFTGHDHWVTGALVSDLKKMPEEEALKKFVDKLAIYETKPSKITKPSYISFFPEPHIGLHTSGNLPEHWGDPPNEFSDAEKTRMQLFRNAILKGVPAVRKRWPEAKIMMPHFVDGLPPDTKLSLGTPDHSDSAPGADAVKLANIGDGSWRISAERDMIYEKNSYYQIRRFPGNMTVATKDAPSESGGKALAVHLGKQEKARYVMPYYTTLVPRRPITITGKGSHLGLWVHAASDWGRVVYTVVDAKGEKWISVGTKDQWNCDDIHCWSAFCFDGWRYLKFELPAHSPYDNFREKGTTWWGSTGGDDIVDLPLKLEKIIVERRTHVMYVNDPQPARPDDVLLGDLYVEYGRPEDNSRKTEKLSRLRMPVPTDVPNLGNPVKDMMATGEVAPTTLTKVTLPEQVADGTRCYVHFAPIEGATKYDIWVSPYADGLGAMLLGKGWKKPGGLLRGLRPDTDFYLFVVHTDKEGKLSRPSDSLKIRLKDLLAMK